MTTIYACLRVALLCPLQLWGNSTHIAPELHREANRVSNTALVAELHFSKQVIAVLSWLLSPFRRMQDGVLCAAHIPLLDGEPSPCQCSVPCRWVMCVYCTVCSASLMCATVGAGCYFMLV
jgi:hypothetical protein